MPQSLLQGTSFAHFGTIKVVVFKLQCIDNTSFCSVKTIQIVSSNE